MAVQTKGVVLTDNKDVLAVCTIAEGSLKRMIYDRQKLAFPDQSRLLAFASKQYSVPTVVLMPSSGMAQFRFTCDGNDRTLTLHFKCDCDHLEFSPHSLSLSLGCSGDSEFYMRHVLGSLSVFGPTLIDLCDSDDVGLAPLIEDRATLISLVAQRVISPYEFEDLRLKYPDSSASKSLEFLGCTTLEAHQFDAIDDHKKRWDALKIFADSRTSSPVSDHHSGRKPKP